MRVSDSMRFDVATRSIATQQQQMLEASRQASTGARIAAPSDDPVAAAQLARVQASLDESSTYQTTIRAVRGDLDTAESALAAAADVYANALEIAQRGANGSLSASERKDLATQVSQLKDQLSTLANTKGSLGYVFGGSKTDSAPFTASGAFVGDDAARNVEVGRGLVVSTNASGAKAFTAAGGRDVFADLTSLQSALEANDGDAIAATIDGLDESRRQIVGARVDVGLKIERLTTSDTVQDQAQVALGSQRHTLADADAAQSYSRLIAVQQSLEAAIAVARNTLSSLGSVGS